MLSLYLGQREREREAAYTSGKGKLVGNQGRSCWLVVMLEHAAHNESLYALREKDELLRLEVQACSDKMS